MKTDILIIGAGPAGTVAAAMIKKAGLDVLVIEKEKFPRYVIGESLLPRCMDVLEDAGLLKAVEKQGYQKKYGALFIRNEQECLFNFSDQHTQGWSWTWQVPRDHFDKVLADEVENMGAQILYESAVTDIDFQEDKQIVKVKTGDRIREIESRFVIDASGYGRVIPRLLDLDLPSSLNPRSSLFTQAVDVKRSNTEVDQRITIIDAEPGVWIWIIPFSNGNTSVGFVAPPEFFEKYQGSNEEKLRQMLADQKLTAERFEGVDYIFDPIFIPSYSIAIKALHGKGWVVAGNATEFLDPVFSSGVTFALESGWKSGILAAKQLKGEAVDWAEEYDKHLLQGVETFRTYVNAWYDGKLQTIFFAHNVNPKIKRQICSVLAGYVWDKTNSYVRNHRNALNTLVSLLEEGQI
jgi:flavin-dependent dehydrogenase